jgi:hypothetical protein
MHGESKEEADIESVFLCRMNPRRACLRGTAFAVAQIFSVFGKFLDTATDEIYSICSSRVSQLLPTKFPVLCGCSAGLPNKNRGCDLMVRLVLFVATG